jgi:hypothetical protein
MHHMTQQLLTPNPQDWVSGVKAAEIVGVTYQSFHRYIAGPQPLITRYTIAGSTRPMFWLAEVEQFRDARNRTRRTPDE